MIKFKIYNHSSIEMNEVPDNSVDLVITSPPYNIGTAYNDFRDRLDSETYRNLLDKVFSECFRVLKRDGLLVIDVADSIFSSDQYIALAGLIQRICLDLGLFLNSRHINFIYSDGKHKELPDHNWNADYFTKVDAHSNCHQWLVFGKSKKEWVNGNIYYLNYKSKDGHPCPFPPEIIKTLLDLYYKKDGIVLDPFAGIAELGVEVINRGGEFIGYEIDKKYYNTALKNLEKVT